MERANQSAVFVVTARTFDWKSRGESHYFEGLPPTEEFALSDDLDNTELDRLAQYLIRIQIAANDAESRRMIEDAQSRAAKDTLGVLWALIPQARDNITNSVRDELFRIGDARTLQKIVIGRQTHGPETIQKAYKLAAVSDDFRTALPVEVLASALQIDFQTWIETEAVATYVTGLLDANTEEDRSTYYRPRTGAVTDIIIEAINGGRSQRGVEMELIKQLLSACTGSSVIYREFGLSVLKAMRNHEWLSYEQGSSLFDALEQALPYKDKTLVHHRANWIRKRGQNPTIAKQFLREALGTPDYPNTDKHEADEHIYTSIAACALDEIERNSVSFEAGKQEVISNLAKARSESFFNTNAVHVNARLTKRLLTKMPDGLDRVALANEALAEVDRALLLVSGGNESRASKDREMLSTARLEIFSESDPTVNLEETAFTSWEQTKSQDTFILACRRLLQRAQQSKSGSDFNRAFDYWKRVDAFLGANKTRRAPGLSEVCLHLYYEWAIHNSRRDRQPVDWLFALSLCEDARSAARSKQDPFYLYLQALCLAQLGRWPDANTTFSNVRRSNLPRGVRSSLRDYLTTDDGAPRVLQGQVKSSQSYWTVYSQELRADFMFERKTPLTQGAHINFVVGFSFNGPLAIPK